MFDPRSKVTEIPKKAWAIIVVVLGLAIGFETLQQLFYIERFNLAEGVTFLGLLKGQAYRWLLWGILGYILYVYCKKNRFDSENVLKNLFYLILVVLTLVFLNVVFISILQMLLNGEPIFSDAFFTEYLAFYVFQKAPIYTLGYIAITMIFHLYFSNSELQIEVMDLLEVKKKNAKLYAELKESNEDKASVLNIKIGNKRRIIPVSQIYWIEADDYCVKVHTLNSEELAMRTSLKALDRMLGTQYLRVHRGALVNMKFAREIKVSNPPALILENGQEVQVAKSQLKTVNAFFAG